MNIYVILISSHC